MSSITVVSRLMFDAEVLDAIDFLAAGHLQSRDEYIQGIITHLARDRLGQRATVAGVSPFRSVGDVAAEVVKGLKERLEKRGHD